MGIFHFFGKKEVTPLWPVTLGAAAQGRLIPMEEIPDPVFSEGILGICCGIEPETGAVYAPVSGRVVQLADTLHAVGLEGPGGVEVLIHIGVDTVEMKGDGFEAMVRAGSSVEKGQLLLTMDLEKIRKAPHPATVITIVTNTGDFASVETAASKKVAPGETVMEIRN